MYCVAKCAGICPEQHYIPVNYAERIEVCKGGPLDSAPMPWAA